MPVPEVGIYLARLCDAPVIHDKADDNPPGSGVQAWLPCEVIEGPQKGCRITAIRTLITKEGVIQLNEWSRLQEIFGSYPEPTDMFAEDQTGKQFEIDVQEETYQGETSKRVKWINPVGGSGLKMPKPVNAKSFTAKYGSKFRALAGPVKPAAKPAAPPPPTPTGPTATMEECWAAMCKKHPNEAEENLALLWFKMLKEDFGTDNNSQIKPHQWGALLGKLTT